MTGLTLTPEAVPWIVAAIVLAILLACLAVVVWRTTHTPRRRLLATVKAISSDALSDIVIPDGLDGQIHLDLVLLTVRGILVLDIKDHRGSVFAGANMEQWTVMDGPRRISVRNPLGALHDRVHALEQLVEHEVPVEGRAVFTGDAKFVKGRPDGVMLLSELRESFARRNDGDERAIEAFRPRWQRVREVAARPS